MEKYFLINKNHIVMEGTLVKAWSGDKSLLEEYMQIQKEPELYEIVTLDKLLEFVIEIE